jgi:threonine dehydratase
MSAWPITLADVEAARDRLRPHLPPTPLRSYPALDEAVGRDIRVLVKHENFQPTGAFKVRNGLSALTALAPVVLRRGVVAATRGNHGLGLAWAGARLGAPVAVCVPLGNNPEKNAAVRGLGARLVEEGRDYDESVRAAERLVREEGLHLVHSTNDPAVVAGAGTLTLRRPPEGARGAGREDRRHRPLGGQHRPRDSATGARRRHLTRTTRARRSRPGASPPGPRRFREIDDSFVIWQH